MGEKEGVNNFVEEIDRNYNNYSKNREEPAIEIGSIAQKSQGSHQPESVYSLYNKEMIKQYDYAKDNN